MQRFNDSTAPVVIAHRGARAYAPENTIEAFQKAAALGAGMVELDVQLCGDAEIMVLHDDDLVRTTNVVAAFPGRPDYRVSSFTRAEIQSLDAGSWWLRAIELPAGQRPDFLRSLRPDEAEPFISADDRAHYASGRVRPPTLGEALAAIQEFGLRVNIELKAGTDCSELVRAVLALIGAAPFAAETLVSSFDRRALALLHELAPQLAIGLLVERAPDDPVACCRAVGATAYHPGCYGDYDAVGFGSAEYVRTGRLPRAPLAAVRAAGLAVNVWTENEPARMRALIDVGASGIFTDYPNRMVDLLNC